MKKVLIVCVLFVVVITSVKTETWREFRNRVEVMSERVLVPKYFDSDDWLDNLAAVIVTHDWCNQMYNIILKNDNTIGEGERTGILLSQMLHEMKYKEFWDKAERLSPNARVYVFRRCRYWWDHLTNGGWITFRDMK